MKTTIIYDSTLENKYFCQSSLVSLIDMSYFDLLDINQGNFYDRLKKNSNFIINLVDDGLPYLMGETSLPSILELLNKDYFGSNPETILLASNKATYRQFIQENKLLKLPKHIITKKDTIPYLSINFYPVIVKPVYTTGSIGISHRNIAHNVADLKIFIEKYNLEIFIIEEYISGNECTISSMGNSENTLILPILWYQNDSINKILTYNAKWEKSSEEYKQYNKILTEPNEMHRTIMRELNRSLNIQDYSKADFIEKDNIYYLIDVSPNPTLTQSSAFIEQFLFRFKELNKLIPELLKSIK